MGPDTTILDFLMLSFKPVFSREWKSFPLFHFHQEALWFLFDFCWKGGVNCISEVIYIFPKILISACCLSSPAFCIYSAYKLNKQDGNIQPWHTPFPIWNQSVVPCPVLTVASWPACRFLKRQIRCSDIPTFTNFPEFVVIHTVKGFSATL